MIAFIRVYICDWIALSWEADMDIIDIVIIHLTLSQLSKRTSRRFLVTKDTNIKILTFSPILCFGSAESPVLIQFCNSQLYSLLKYSLSSLVTKSCGWELKFDFENALSRS